MLSCYPASESGKRADYFQKRKKEKKKKKGKEKFNILNQSSQRIIHIEFKKMKLPPETRKGPKCHRDAIDQRYKLKRFHSSDVIYTLTHFNIIQINT